MENITSTSVSQTLLLWMKLFKKYESIKNIKWIKVQIFWEYDKIHESVSYMTKSFEILSSSVEGERGLGAHTQAQMSCSLTGNAR